MLKGVLMFCAEKTGFKMKKKQNILAKFQQSNVVYKV